MVEPHTQMPPPPPPPVPNPNLPMLYYALVVIGTAAMVLALYNLIISRWCADPTDSIGPQRPIHGVRLTATRSFSSARLLSSFKYSKAADEGNDDFECAVCLSVFEEGEELRQLPNCKHSFHVPCIDMWLYSHVDCPLCRTPVEEPLPLSQR